MTRRTLFDKVWDAHVVTAPTGEQPAVLYIDLHLVHEVTSPQAFALLRERGLPVRRPERTLATMDHATPTTEPAPDGTWPGITPDAAAQIQTLRDHCAAFGIELCAPGSGRGGIAHVIAPEQGATQPGMTIVCGDSHTATHGAFGALAFGIGTTEVGHVLATQCLLQRRPKTCAVEFRGACAPGVSAKDLALGLIAQIGPGGGTGHVLEYRGDAVRALSMEGRMTLCNMAIEAGARAGMIAPDDTTLRALRGRPRAPAGRAFDAAAERWLTLRSDADADFDQRVECDVTTWAPQVTYGTHPGMSMAVDGRVPAPRDASEELAFEYMAIEPGSALQDRPVDVVFVGSCTNGRIEDLRAAAAVLRGRRVRERVRMVVVPGSERVRAAAEDEGLDRVFRAAGAEWRAPGCSMCIAMNGDRVPAGAYAVSTSNRNFQGRQGPGARTLLASPWTAAASAVLGHVADPRPLLTEEVPHA